MPRRHVRLVVPQVQCLRSCLGVGTWLPWRKFAVMLPFASTLAHLKRTLMRLGPASLQGAKLLPLLASVLPGLVLRFLVPAPAAVSLQGWNLLCLFVSTIAGGSGCKVARLWQQHGPHTCVAAHDC